jgi:hypothetical protein
MKNYSKHLFILKNVLEVDSWFLEFNGVKFYVMIFFRSLPCSLRVIFYLSNQSPCLVV